MNASLLSTLTVGSAAWSAMMLRACWLDGLFLLAVWLVCRAIRRLSPTVRAWLWWIACLKIVLGILPLPALWLPLLPPHPAFNGPRPQSLPQLWDNEATSLPTPLLKERGEERTDWQSVRVHAGGHLAAGHTAKEFIPSRYVLTAPPLLAKERGSGGEVAPALLLMGLWVLGIVWRLGSAAAQMRKSFSRLRQAQPIQGAAVLAQAGEIGAALGLRRLPALRVSEAGIGPMIVGLPRPVVLLPRSLLSPPPSPALRMVLAHELAHLRRGDLWLVLIPLLARTLFWFHPLVWLAVWEYRIASESACDAETLRITGATAHDYGLLLLQFAAYPHRAGAMALGSSSGYHILARRLKMLRPSAPISRQRTRRNLICLLGLSVVCLLPWRLVSAHADQAQPQSGPTAATTATSAQQTTDGTSVPQTSSSATPAQPSTQNIATARPLSADTPAQMSTPAKIVRPKATAPAVSRAVPAKQTLAVARATTFSYIARAQGAAVIAQSPPSKITLDLGETTIYAALMALFRQAQVSYRMDADVIEIARATPVTISIRNASFQTALRMLINSSRSGSRPLTYVYEDGFYVIQATSAPVKQSIDTTSSSRPIPILGDLPVIGGLFKSRDAQATRSSGFGGAEIDSSSSGGPAGGSVGFGGGGSGGRSGGFGGSGFGGGFGVIPRIEDILKQKVSLELDHADLPRALAILFNQVHANFVLDSSLPDDKVTLSLRDVSFRVALESILSQPQRRLTYRVENNIIHVMLSDRAN